MRSWETFSRRSLRKKTSCRDRSLSLLISTWSCRLVSPMPNSSRRMLESNLLRKNSAEKNSKRWLATSLNSNPKPMKLLKKIKRFRTPQLLISMSVSVVTLRHFLFSMRRKHASCFPQEIWSLIRWALLWTLSVTKWMHSRSNSRKSCAQSKRKVPSKLQTCKVSLKPQRNKEFSSRLRKTHLLSKRNHSELK